MGKIITDGAAVFRVIYGIAAGLCLAIFMGLSILNAAGDWRGVSAMAEELMRICQFYIIPLGVSFLVWNSRLQEKDHLMLWYVLWNILWQIVMIMAAAALMILAVKLINLSRGYISPVSNLPKSIVYYGVLAGGVGVIVQCAANLVMLFQRGGNADGEL